MRKLYRNFKNARVVFLFSILVGLMMGLTFVGLFGIDDKDIDLMNNINSLLLEQNMILKDELIHILKDIGIE